MDKPKVSFVIPVFNTHPWLVQDAIDSCLFQIGIESEIIVVDDGSTTRWYDTVELDDFRIKFFKLETNQGVAVAWDRGIKESTSDYVCPMAADDFLHPDKTILQLELMKQAKVEFSYTGYRELFFNDQDQLTQIRTHGVKNVPENDGKQVFLKLTEGDYCNNFINGASVIMAKEVYNSTPGYDPALRYKQDYDLWLQIAHRHKILGVPFNLMTRRIHSNQAKYFFSKDKELNETTRRTKEYALIKLKWEDSVFPVVHPAVDVDLLKQMGYN